MISRQQPGSCGAYTLVFLESHGGELQKGSLGVLTKAATLGDAVSAVLVGGPPADGSGARQYFSATNFIPRKDAWSL